jgi:hypothetical protein
MSTVDWCLLGVSLALPLVTVGYALVVNVDLFRSWSRSQDVAADLLATGTPGTAVVVTSQWDGRVVNLEYQVGLTLRVTVPGRAPYDVRTTESVDPVRAGALQPGATVAVRVDAADPQHVLVDFSQPATRPTAIG